MGSFEKLFRSMSAALIMAASTEALGQSKAEGGFWVDITEVDARRLMGAALESKFKVGHTKAELSKIDNYLEDYSNGICTVLGCGKEQYSLYCRAPNFGVGETKAQINFTVTASRENDNVNFVLNKPFHTKGSDTCQYVFTNNLRLASYIRETYWNLCTSTAPKSSPKP